MNKNKRGREKSLRKLLIKSIHRAVRTMQPLYCVSFDSRLLECAVLCDIFRILREIYSQWGETSIINGSSLLLKIEFSAPMQHPTGFPFIYTLFILSFKSAYDIAWHLSNVYGRYSSRKNLYTRHIDKNLQLYTLLQRMSPLCVLEIYLERI